MVQSHGEIYDKCDGLVTWKFYKCDGSVTW